MSVFEPNFRISSKFQNFKQISLKIRFVPTREEAWALYLAKLEEEANYFTVPETEQVPYHYVLLKGGVRKCYKRQKLF